MNFVEYRARRKAEIDEALERLVPVPAGPAGTVAAAMRHALGAGGKRLRPILTLAAAEAAGGRAETLVEPAAALEMIHTYSLIHDDLPAMDDDDLRRGQPTVHVAFNEAVAILAGDALLTLAMEVLAVHPRGDGFAVRRAEAVACVARGAGLAGMVGGQIADLEGQGAEIDPDTLGWIHRHKTGALFRSAAELGAIYAGGSPETREAFRVYGEQIGLAFQIADDVLDRTGTVAELGKTPGKDERSGKATYPALLGLEVSVRRADEHVARALEALKREGLLSPPLEALGAFAVARSR